MNPDPEPRKQQFIGAVMLSIMVSFALLGDWSALVSRAATAARAEQDAIDFLLFLPTVTHNRRDRLGFEVPPISSGHLPPDLKNFNPGYLRTHFASWDDPYDTLYQHYLAGGWAEVDLEVVASLDAWRSIGAEPIVIFMYGETCQVPDYSELEAYGDFIAAAADRYDLRYFEVWNEPDSHVGVTPIWGCFGADYADRLIFLLDRVQMQVDPWREVGVSFMLDGQPHMDMLAEVAPSADWIGIHHYGIWGGGIIWESWPGSLQLKYEMAEEASPKPVWLTEYNLRSPNYECTWLHRQAQANYLLEAFTLDIPVISIIIYADYPDWECTGIRNTPASQALLHMYP